MGNCFRSTVLIEYVLYKILYKTTEYVEIILNKSESSILDSHAVFLVLQ